MTLFCKIGDKPFLYYRFSGDSSDKIIGFEIAPINVLISNTSSQAGNKCGSSYGVWSMTTYDTITANSPFSYQGYEGDSPVFNNRTITSACDGRLFYQDSGYDGGPIQAKNIVFTPNSSNSYTIQVKNLDFTNLLFTDTRQTNTPPTYKVVCGDGCPEGYLKCNSDNYPGYCCIPCQNIENRIDALIRQVKR